MDNNVIDITYALLPMPSEANQCLSSPINSPINATSVLSINGKVTDAAGHGVNGITVDFGIVGGGSWTAGNVGSNSFSGTTSLSMKEPSAVTDCNGNFTAEILIHIVLGYSQGFFAGFDTPFFPIPTPSGTLTVSSGNLARAITIISFNDFISAYNCIYVGGVLA